MGRGSSKAGGAVGGGGKLATEALTRDGTVIDLSDTPLQYGQKDSAITGKLRESLEAQETKRLSAKIEYGAVYDEEGNVIGTERKGNRSSVGIPNSDYSQATAMTHNHPRKSGDDALGGTFSTADFNCFTKFDNLKTMRASASEGTYSITKGKNFDSQKFKKFTNDSANKRGKEYNQKVSDLGKDYRAGKMTYNEYSGKADKAFNAYLVSLHNDLLAGQKEYGYSYTLEPR